MEQEVEIKKISDVVGEIPKSGNMKLHKINYFLL
jgi:hypothetical protein